MEYSLGFTEISQRLRHVDSAESVDTADHKPAAVALILREAGCGLELFFIERARHPLDPWSGNIGLPGGRMDARDADLRQTAERETMEEVGIDLRGARYLGRLSDVIGANLPVRVACFVYGVTGEVALELSHEVHDAFWFDLQALAESHRHIAATVHFEGRRLDAPAILLHQHRPVLWGITYRLVCQFRQVVEGSAAQAIPYELPL